MGAGFVYIMVNPARRGIVRIGVAADASNSRSVGRGCRNQLDEFFAVYSEFVVNVRAVEDRLHRRFEDYRCIHDRGLFQLPATAAIRGMIEASAGLVVPPSGMGHGVEILPELKRRYGDYLKPHLRSIKVCRIADVIYMESVRCADPGRREEVVERTDLTPVFRGDMERLRPPANTDKDAKRLVDQLDRQLSSRLTDLFSHERREEVARRREYGYPITEPSLTTGY